MTTVRVEVRDTDGALSTNPRVEFWQREALVRIEAFDENPFDLEILETDIRTSGGPSVLFSVAAEGEARSPATIVELD